MPPETLVLGDSVPTSPDSVLIFSRSGRDSRPSGSETSNPVAGDTCSRFDEIGVLQELLTVLEAAPQFF